MNPQFYDSNDKPTEFEKELMWHSISSEMQENRLRSVSIIHWRSFWYGSVAAVFAFFAFYGAYTLFISQSNSSYNKQAQVDMVYDSALKELASLSPTLIEKTEGPERQRLESQIQNLDEIDLMIKEIRSDMLLNGSSELKRRQLRRLYALKMDQVKALLLADQIRL